MVKSFTVGLLPCGSKKRDYACPARDMYTSPFFRKARTYAEIACDDWLVITTKYGPCFPEQEIEPYDDYLGKKPRSQWRVWFDWIYPEPFLSMLLRKKKDQQKVIIWSVLPKPFNLFLHPALHNLGFIIQAPLLDMTMGFRMKGINNIVGQLYETKPSNRKLYSFGF